MYLILITLATVQLCTAAIQIHAVAPAATATPLNINFPGFAFETDSFIPYVGAPGSPNQFTLNLINSIVSRTGGIPIVRVGGTTGDNGAYNRSQTAPITGVVLGQNVTSERITVGPSFFKYFSLIPKAKYILQVSLVPQVFNPSATTSSTNFAVDAIKTIGINNIQTIELGNEPGYYYAATTEQQEQQDEQQYVNIFLSLEKAITGNVSVGTAPIYQAVDDASQDLVFDPTMIYQDGINSNGKIKEISFHYYQTAAQLPGANVSLLMNHTAITTRLDAYQPYIAYFRQNAPNITLTMDEVGNSFTATVNSKVTPALSYQAVLGSALWQADFQLYSMVTGFSKVNLQQHTTSGFNLWVPGAVQGYFAAPFVQAPYYAQPFIADFIGPSGQTTIQYFNLTVNNATDPLHSSYGAYDNGVLTRIAFVNFRYWTSTIGFARPSIQFQIVVPSGKTSAKVEYLTAPDGATGNQTVTWADTQWTYANSNGVASGNNTITVPVVNGSVIVTIPASSAAIVFLS